MEKKLKKLGIAILIFILIIISIILIILKKMNVNEGGTINNIEGEKGEVINFESLETHNVTNKVEYYTVRNCINNYLSILNSEDAIYHKGFEYDINTQKNNIYNLLSSEYIKNENITKNNILDKIETVEDDEIFIPLEMKVLENVDVNKYLAYGIIQNTDNEYKRKLYIIVNLNMSNKTYSIEPLKDIKNIDEVKLTNNNIAIEKNDVNVYRNQNITNEYIANEYFLLFKRIMLSNSEIAYNLMNDDYKSQRFINIENFQRYINDNKKELLKVTMKEFAVNNYEDNIEYIVKDQYGNLYIFNEYENQVVKVKLDTYTLDNDVFIETYEKSTDEKKIQMNVDKFIQMINRHDYITSYNCISEGFKNNYFNTQEKFENYIKNIFFNYNKFEFKNITKKGSNLYTCDLNITDLTGENTEIRTVTIIMQLNDNLDFKMSFSIE